MKLVAKTDVNAAPEALFGALCDRDWLEALARRGGAVVGRLDQNQTLCKGAGWDVRFHYRGRERHLTSRVDALDRPRLLVLHGESSGFETGAEVLLTPLSRQTTRMSVVLDIKPRSFTARLILQTLKIGKSRLKERLEARLQAMGEALKERAEQRENR